MNPRATVKALLGSTVYELEVSPAADRDLAKIRGRIRKQDLERIILAVDGLAEEPRPAGVRKLKGGVRAYRIRVGRYRVVYEVYDDDSLVVVLHVGRRTETTYCV